MRIDPKKVTALAKHLQDAWNRQPDLPGIEFTEEETHEVAAELLSRAGAEGWVLERSPL
ncbi:hypothetical protein [Novosphingobium sp. MBES04]|uniref:hypothetical protein n=1 Tax=Novosphingobium sp. MBES04 TaxID=1206458 RepID=UPI00131ED313|nr:hypothetical protein [Novosphingobium sp. MBES04]